MFVLLFIGMCVSLIVAWQLIRRLQARPWTQQGIIPGSHDASGLTSSAPKVGLWAFLGVVTSLFLVFIGAYFMRMSSSHGGVPSGVLHPWVPLDEPAVLWLNTALLILASLTIQKARNAATASDIDAVRKYFTSAGGLTILFLGGQLLAWRQLSATGNFGPGDPAYSFFILLTAVHGLHLLGGLVVWARTAERVWTGLDGANVVEVSAMRQSVELCATYWHYLLMVWLVLFTMLLST